MEASGHAGSPSVNLRKSIYAHSDSGPSCAFAFRMDQPNATAMRRFDAFAECAGRTNGWAPARYTLKLHAKRTEHGYRPPGPPGDVYTQAGGEPALLRRHPGNDGKRPRR